jgi:uncharacterized protein YjcR
MTDTYTPADVAEMLHTTEANVLQWRRQHGWPSLKVGKTIRFTHEHVEQILAKHTVKPAKKSAPTTSIIAGQTKRSARRAS